MSGQDLGQRAVVIGAGMGGLAAAAALAGHYAEVTILERDSLPAGAVPRAGAPQGRHFHALLTGGLQALEHLCDGFSADLEARGAVRLTQGYDMRFEASADLPHEPRRDLGLFTYSLSRPLLEDCLRRRVLALDNVTIRTGASVQRLMCDPRGDVCGVVVRAQGEVSANLVVDASGRAQPTLELLKQLGLSSAPTSHVKLNQYYATAVFEIPGGLADGFKGIMTFPTPGQSTRGGLLAAMEGGRYILALGSRHDDRPPAEPGAYLEFARGLRTDSIYNAIKDAPMVGGIERYTFTGAYHRHFERVDGFPRGLLPLGDALCRLNPVYGQGMSVAAKEAHVLKQLLTQVREGKLATKDLQGSFFGRAADVIHGPWVMSTLPDLVDPATEGERPDDLMDQLIFSWAVNQVARVDPEVHRLMAEVGGLLKPRSAYDAVAERAQAVIAAAAAAGGSGASDAS